VTGIFDPRRARRRCVRSAAGRRQVHQRSISGPRWRVIVPGPGTRPCQEVLASGERYRRCRQAATRRACAPALLLPRRAVSHFVRVRLHGGVMKRARRSLSRSPRSPRLVPRPGSPVARRRTGCRARKTGNRRHGFPAVPGRDNRPGGRRPRGTTGVATAAHPVPCQNSHTDSDLVFCVITRLLSRTR
jgi:hypothetical protein